MAKKPTLQQTFEGGETDPQYARRSDVELHRATVRAARNFRLRNGGTARRRPGTNRIKDVTDGKRGIPVKLRDVECSLVFRTAAVEIVLEDGTVEDTVTSCPWSADDVATLQVAPEEAAVIITSRSFRPRVLTRADDGSWTINAIAFDAGAESSIVQPYFRFGQRGVSLTPSANTGSITLEATGTTSLFTSDHVGVRFRLHEREVQITAVTDGNTATATVIQTLYPNIDITVADSSGFALGEEVETDVTQVRGFVTALSAGHVFVQLTEGFTNPTSSDKLTGPNAQTTVTSVASASTAATLIWDEAMISPARGYPGACVRHRNRLGFADFPRATSYIALSQVGAQRNFDVGTAQDHEAIIDALGDEPGARIRHMLSTEQLLVFTDVGTYYCGEGPQSPVTPTTFDFLAIGEERIGDVPPLYTAEGAIFSDSRSGRLILLAQTGNVRRAWEGGELDDFAPHLTASPTDLVLVDGGELGRERYLMLPQEDGTIAVGLKRRRSEFAGWTPWETDGEWLSVWQLGSRVFALANRDGTVTLEYFSDDRLTDCSVYFTDPTAATALISRTDLDLVKQHAATGRRAIFFGQYDTDGSGLITDGPTGAGFYHLGRRFETDLTLWPPIDPRYGFSYGPGGELADTYVDVLDSGMFYTRTLESDSETPVPAFEGGDDMSIAPPLFTGIKNSENLGVGSRGDTHLQIIQVEPAPLEVRAITYEMA